MPETVSLLAVTPGDFSDDVLVEIIKAVALCGEQPIAQLAAFIRNFRRLEVPLETDISRIWRDSYVESLCHALYLALMQEELLDFLGRLDLEKLRVWAQRSR
ncbi:hypothetical protein NIES2135_20950 [Leptolyngbya boryana NIES-2135]|jgi:hypothetical protein|uniref:Uncharacterized protein n=1 Tax=Leptolyngbya boryana NIES-2135 TaxID=1973484 RepID=A0A1Z4JES7_LEPBY|nr:MULTISPECIES: hypothetical protein [Leptolyngbya]BAY55272.1 hypothetical protein NIES2135_20950 [Leptolyngbya boryana NIES-2135]MBD2369356.1 hypothetical protein [Leptolyngbya sp. FACHB-161]MBD2375642.1 hypothetical protein [Leptolyngbya sp. FACHB-238]MBD2401685.1 hypothetical protein [Leptolyngbya sp. FACHB-239]MBD2406576.1 hypothetical protein [Leptolyngbya sp. FACHB-402]